MAPEQVRGAAVDSRTDIFAFGAVLYEMISGQRAFRRDTAAETMTAILKEDPPELERDGSSRLAGPGAHCPALPGEAAGAAFPIRKGPGVRARSFEWNDFEDSGECGYCRPT
jgi:serine/threonine protein kinase